MTLRIAFMGTPAFAVAALSALTAAGHHIAAVYSQPPRAAGRGMAERKSPVHDSAESMGLTVRTPISFRDETTIADFAALKLDAAVVVAYGLLLPQAALASPRHGCFNIHASLLPRWRGAAPIQRAIMAGDAETGLAIMRMEEGLDTGPVCLVERLRIGAAMTAGELHDQLAALSGPLIVKAMAALETGSLSCQPQSTQGIVYARKIDKAEAGLDFARSAADVLRQIHGLSPVPGAWFGLTVKDKPQRVRILKAELLNSSGPAGTVLDDDLAIACAAGAIRPLVLQREGKGPMARADFLRGLAIPSGTRLQP